MNSRNLMLLTSVLGLAISNCAGQTTTEASTKRPITGTGSHTVVVDTAIVDKKGAPIPNITQKEFHVWEDNKEQPIKSISHESSATRTRIILLFGKMSPSELIYARDKATQFIKSSASPNRLIALMSFLDNSGNLTATQGFTSDTDLLQRAAADLRTAGTNEQEPTLDQATTEIMISPEGPTSDGTPPSRQEQARRYHDYNQTTQQDANENKVKGLSLLYAIRDIARNLGNLPGRKALVMIAPHFQYKLRPEDIAPIAEACNKANLTVYTIDIRSDSSSVVDNTLEQLLDSTGGFGTDNPNDTLGALNRIASEQSDRYFLNYVPAELTQNTCRNLKVTVDRPGARVRSRTTFCDIKPNDPLAGTAIDSDLQALAKGTGPGKLSVTMQSPYFYSSPTSARVHATAELSTNEMNFEKRNGKLHATLNVLGIAYKPNGEVGARFTDSVDFDFENKSQVEQFKSHPYRYEKQFAADSGDYDFKFVFSSGPETFARTQARLTVDPTDGKRLALGGLALCRETRSAAVSGTSVAVLADQVPLVSQGIEYVPSGLARLKKTDAAGVYFELYEPGLKEAHPTALKFRIRVLDRKTGAVVLDSDTLGVDMSKWTNPVVPVGWKFAMNKLTPGSYRILVAALDDNGTAPLRAMDFEVE